jgi:hypothetical protein
LQLRTTIKMHIGFPQTKTIEEETWPLFSSQGDLSCPLISCVLFVSSLYLEACIGNGILKGLHLEDYKG